MNKKTTAIMSITEEERTTLMNAGLQPLMSYATDAREMFRKACMAGLLKSLTDMGDWVNVPFDAFLMMGHVYQLRSDVDTPSTNVRIGIFPGISELRGLRGVRVPMNGHCYTVPDIQCHARFLSYEYSDGSTGVDLEVGKRGFPVAVHMRA